MEESISRQKTNILPEWLDFFYRHHLLVLRLVHLMQCADVFPQVGYHNIDRFSWGHCGQPLHIGSGVAALQMFARLTGLQELSSMENYASTAEYHG